MAERAVESVSTFLDLEVGKRLLGCLIRAADPVKMICWLEQVSWAYRYDL